ncbi:MAG TPA: hypothetical protein VFH12_00145 [Pseudoxanthomonas sp.]|nr:hypothetical protein [Pseudoxanthomonas sp.]
MNQENPYEPPVSVVDPAAGTPPGRWKVMLLLVIAFQTLVVALYASTMFSHIRRGEISPLTFGVASIASVLLLLGGLMYSRKSRYAAPLFFISALCAAVAYFQWRVPFLVTGFVIAVCAGLVSVVAQRRPAKV